MPLFKQGANYYFQDTPGAPATQVLASPGGTYDPSVAQNLPSGTSTVPFGGTYSFSPSGEQFTVPNPNASTAPSMTPYTSTNPPPPTGSPITSSSSPDIQGQLMSVLSGLFTQTGSANNQAQQLIATQGQAALQQLQAQKLAGDQMFANQVADTKQAGAEALGQSQVNAAMTNPTGTYTGNSGIPLSTAQQGMQSYISNQFQDSVNNIEANKASFDASILAGQTTAAAQTMAASLQSTASSIQNQFGIVSAISAMAQGQQNFGLQMAGYQMQANYNAGQLATSQLNAILPTIQGVGWKNMSPSSQSGLQTMLQSVGLPPSLAQTFADTSTLAQLGVSTDLLGNTTFTGFDKNMNIISSYSAGGGVSPTSSAGIQSLGVLPTYIPGSNNSIGIITPDMITGSGKALSALGTFGVAGALNGAGKNIIALSNVDGAAVKGNYTAMQGLSDMVNTLNSGKSGLATSTGTEISGFLNRAIESFLGSPAITPYLAENADLLSAMKAVAGFSGGGGGIGTSAVVHYGGNDIKITKDTQIPTIIAMAQQLAQSLYSKSNVLASNRLPPLNASFPDLAGANVTFNSFSFGQGLSGAGGGGSSGFSIPKSSSASPSSSSGGSSFTDPRPSVTGFGNSNPMSVFGQ